MPQPLKPGDTIGIVCPAGYMNMDKVQTCINTLKEWGFQVKVGSTVGGHSQTYFSGTDEERLADLQQMMDDDEIKAVLCGRGGYGTGRIIERINFKKFRKHPKWIIGYSDITVLHAHLYTNYNISSLHAPMAAAFNNEGYKNEFVQSLRNVLTGGKMKYQCKVHELNQRGEAIGELIGGNLALLAHIIGTLSDYKTKGKILFIEDVGEQLYNLDRMMFQLKRSGKFSHVAGLIFGGFSDTKDTERPFGKTIYEILSEIVKGFDFPICFDFPVSHTDENYALKIGVRCRLKVSKNKVLLEEKS